MSKKKLLTSLLGLMGVFGLVFALIPLAKSMLPTSEAVNAATLNVDVSEISSGSYKQISWQGKPVVIYYADSDVIKELVSLNEKVWGPAITAENSATYYVYEKLSTHLGCALWETKDRSYDDAFPPGWWDPCHMGAWDYAGRAYKELNVPMGVKLDNLHTVNYRILDKGEIQLLPWR